MLVPKMYRKQTTFIHCIRINNNLQIFTLHKKFRILLSAFQLQRIHDNSVQRPIGPDKNQLRPTLSDNREKMFPWDKDSRQMQEVDIYDGPENGRHG